MCSCVPRPISGEGDHNPDMKRCFTSRLSDTKLHTCVGIGGARNNVTQSVFIARFFFRFQDGSGSGSGSVTFDQKFLLKWSVPLSFVEVLEFGSSEDMADTGRFPAPHSGEKVVISAKPSMTQFHSQGF